MLKKPSVLCSCCGGLQLLGPPPSAARSWRHLPVLQSPRRYAHVLNSNNSSANEDLSWPTSQSFSPYDLFKQERHAAYSKKRFYEMVQIYHPDKTCNHHPASKDVPLSDRMHRYRILVAAHQLLSDPAKREAYDKYGLGWHDRTELFGPKAAEKSFAARNVQYARHRDDPDSIFNNATWEDWEAWYERRDGRGPQVRTVSHSTFASFLVLLTLFFGVGQAVTIGKYASSVDERAKGVSAKRGKFLDGRRQETVTQSDSTDARVQSFLRKRDPSGYGLKEDEEETYRKFLSAHRTTSDVD